jgi:hypothetical protein
MTSEPKPFASLSSGLLARKGAARPAMRPQGFGQVGGNLDDLGWNDMGFEPPKPAETGRDSEHDAFGQELTPHPSRNPLAALTPIGSPVHEQQAELADRFGETDDSEPADEDYDETAELVAVEEIARQPEAAPVAVPTPTPSIARRQSRPRSAPGAKGKAAFTLRLDPERHLKLRLACAVNGRSAQQLVTDAVDRLLADMPELDSMAQRAPSKRAQA